MVNDHLTYIVKFFLCASYTLLIVSFFFSICGWDPSWYYISMMEF